MRGTNNQPTIQDNTCATCYQTTVNKAGRPGVAINGKTQNLYRYAPASVSNLFPISGAKKAENKIQKAPLIKRISITVKEKANDVKGFLNIFKINITYLANGRNKAEKIRLNYCTELCKKDLLLRPLKNVCIENFTVAKQDAFNEAYPLVQKQITPYTPFKNRGVFLCFYYAFGALLIKRKSEAAQWSYKSSSNYYFSEKPSIKRAFEPPSS